MSQQHDPPINAGGPGSRAGAQRPAPRPAPGPLPSPPRGHLLVFWGSQLQWLLGQIQIRAINWVIALMRAQNESPAHSHPGKIKWINCWLQLFGPLAASCVVPTGLPGTIRSPHT